MLYIRLRIDWWRILSFKLYNVTYIINGFIQNNIYSTHILGWRPCASRGLDQDWRREAQNIRKWAARRVRKTRLWLNQTQLEQMQYHMKANNTITTLVAIFYLDALVLGGCYLCRSCHRSRTREAALAEYPPDSRYQELGTRRSIISVSFCLIIRARVIMLQLDIKRQCVSYV